MDQIIKPSLFKPYDKVVSGVSTKAYASLSYSLAKRDRVEYEQKRFFSDLGADFRRIIAMNQVHGRRIRAVTTDYFTTSRNSSENLLPRTDGVCTDEVGIWLMVQVADCIPLLFYDPQKHVIAAAHAGWQGTAKGIAKAVVKKMSNEYAIKPHDLKVYIGPSIGPECFLIDPEEDESNRLEIFRRVFKSHSGILKRQKDGNVSIDIRQANVCLLEKAGVLPENIEISPWCTACRDELASHWREGHKRITTNLAVIGLKG